MKNSIDVKLKDETHYDFKGEKKKAEFVTLKKPTAKNISHTCILKNTFQSGAAEIRKRNESSSQAPTAPVAEEETDESAELSIAPQDALNLFYIAPQESVEKSMIAFKELLRDVCIFDGDLNATKPMIDNLSVDDFENILGEYLVNFILASLFKKKERS